MGTISRTNKPSQFANDHAEPGFDVLLNAHCTADMLPADLPQLLTLLIAVMPRAPLHDGFTRLLL